MLRLFSYVNSIGWKKLFVAILIYLPLITVAQQKDTSKLTAKDPGKTPVAGVLTYVKGQVTDVATGQPLSSVSISIVGSAYGNTSDKQGRFDLNFNGVYTQVIFSYQGYQSITKTIKPGQVNNLIVKLKKMQHQLSEVKITAGKKQRYRNKGNPAVELIQEVINHKDQNRMESADYLQDDQYERINLSLLNLSPRLLNSPSFNKYKFMLDTAQNQAGQPQVSLPVYLSEKLSQNYYRKHPEKNIQVLTAQKDINIIKFIDTVGLDIYLNRLYGNTLDLYSNNIFIIANQFLSPIANHAPDFYKFFIIDTIQVGKNKMVELNFTPRAKGDLLFEGKLIVTLDGRYAVTACELNINKQININFLRTLSIRLDFAQTKTGRYNMTKSDVKADFGIFRDRGAGVIGERTVVYTNYKLDTPQPAEFYDGKSLQIATNSAKADTAYWREHRTEALNPHQAQIYAHMNRLETMPSFKRATWIAATLTSGFATIGPVQFGQIGSIFSYDTQEGPRFQLGGRTTPKLDSTIYFDGYLAYGTRDGRWKYNLNTYFSLNKTAPYRYPNDYFKISFLSDVDVPGHNYSISNAQAALTSFYTGKTDYWIYSKIFNVGYVKDFDNHLSYSIAYRNWNQQAAGTLSFQQNDPQNTFIDNLTVSEADLKIRYAPHEQFIQGALYRHTIYSKYPILNLEIDHGFTGFLNGSYAYNNISGNIIKRFYFSQLGYSDVTLLGGLVTGKVPFPLLKIAPANQTLGYQPDAYNQMDYLEFVSDHYVGVNLTQSFNGFFLNKVPLISHLKWREYLSFKALYGGLRNENNPLYSNNLYQFPTGSNGSGSTYALGNTPYIEAGAGIGNIFKLLRVDLIRRFNYLDHPGISAYGVKFSINPDF